MTSTAPHPGSEGEQSDGVPESTHAYTHLLVLHHGYKSSAEGDFCTEFCESMADLSDCTLILNSNVNSG